MNNYRNEQAPYRHQSDRGQEPDYRSGNNRNEHRNFSDPYGYEQNRYEYQGREDQPLDYNPPGRYSNEEDQTTLSHEEHREDTGSQWGNSNYDSQGGYYGPEHIYRNQERGQYRGSQSGHYGNQSGTRSQYEQQERQGNYRGSQYGIPHYEEPFQSGRGSNWGGQYGNRGQFSQGSMNQYAGQSQPGQYQYRERSASAQYGGYSEPQYREHDGGNQWRQGQYGNLQYGQSGLGYEGSSNWGSAHQGHYGSSGLGQSTSNWGRGSSGGSGQQGMQSGNWNAGGFSGNQSGRARQSGPNSGRGPKGYQRSDDRIKEDVCEVLTEDGQLDASNIEIDVKRGEITLKGTVESREDKRRAEDLIESVSGVKDVQNQIRVQRDGASEGSETSGSSSTAGKNTGTMSGSARSMPQGTQSGSQHLSSSSQSGRSGDISSQSKSSSAMETESSNGAKHSKR